MMAADSLQLEGMVTFPSGTLLQFGNGARDTVYFYDANNNQRLDTSDKKVAESSSKENVLEFTTGRVSLKDIQIFGPRMEAALSQARRERDSLPRLIPSRKIGQCFFSIEGQEGAMTVKELSF